MKFNNRKTEKNANISTASTAASTAAPKNAARAAAVKTLTIFDLKGDRPTLEGIQKKLNNRERSLFTNIFYGVLRNRNKIDFIISSYSKMPIKRMSANLLNILRIAVYQMNYLDRIPDHAIVNQSVRLTRRLADNKLTAFVNGTLRNMLKNPQVTFPDRSDSETVFLSTCHSHPAWMVDRWLARYGFDATLKICQNNCSIPPVSIRVNLAKTSVESIKNQIAGSTLLPVSNVGLTVPGVPGSEDKLFSDGFYYIQDEASQLVSSLLSASAGDRLLDGCAGVGGKTFAIAESLNCNLEITAVEKDEKQTALFKENQLRLGLKNINLVCSNLLDLNKNNYFDKILLDVPCSALGVLRRRPDAKWRKSMDAFDLLKAKQLALLKHASTMLKNGGTLLYSTCSTEPDENWDLVDSFLETHSAFKVVNLSENIPKGVEHQTAWISLIDSKGALDTTLNNYNMDYMFAVLLKKS